MIEARKPAVFLQLKCAEIYCFGTKLLLFLINGSCYCTRNNWKILYSFQKCAGWEHMDNKVRKWCGAELPLLTAKGGVHPIRPYQKDVNGALVTGIERQPKWPCRAEQIKSSHQKILLTSKHRAGLATCLPYQQCRDKKRGSQNWQSGTDGCPLQRQGSAVCGHYSQAPPRNPAVNEGERRETTEDLPSTVGAKWSGLSEKDKREREK